MSYFIGDKPSEDLVIVPARNGEDLDLAEWESATVTITAPDGTATALDTTIVGDQVVAEWPTDSIFEEAGLHPVSLVLESDTARETFTASALAVESEDGWTRIATLRAEWPDAEQQSDRILYALLEMAKEDVLAYAPAIDPSPALPPLKYVEAQRMQARNIWQANAGDAQSGEFGSESFTIRPFPLDWAIKQQLRPKTPKPAIR